MTTPDYAGLIEELRELAKSCGYEYGTESGTTAWNAATALRTLLESNAALERERDSWRDAFSEAAARVRAVGSDERQNAWSALRMIADVIGERFGPIASIESEDASLLRGPEYHHFAEGIVEALLRIPAPQPSGTVKVDDIAAIIYSEMEWASALPGDPGEPIISWDDCDDSPAFAKGRARAAARRILSALTAGKPEQSGWRLVPEEPTEEMYRAVYKVQDDCAIHNYGASPTFDDYWSAALSASPAAPTAGGGDA